MSAEVCFDSMAQKDRISVDITDIKDRIENYRTDPAWRELSMAGRVRALVIEKLEEKETEDQKSSQSSY
jgi:hypothetical protein